MIMDKNILGLGIAGNFAGHLEQANEAQDFKSVKVLEESAPKAIFPNYIPGNEGRQLNIYPYSSREIILANGEENFQIEPEIGIYFNVLYEGKKVIKLEPKRFCAFNDCSIRRPHAKKISEKKNWGPSSKGASSESLEINHFSIGGRLDEFSIACFLKRGDVVHTYGEDSPVKGYSYFYEKLLDWIVEKLNHQVDSGPAEDMSEILKSCHYPETILISIGATKYTEFGETNFLKDQDISYVIVYNNNLYKTDDIRKFVENDDFPAEELILLRQEVRVL